MSTSYYIVGMRPPDEKFKLMEAIFDACMKADVEIPNDVEDFFDGRAPNSEGLEVGLPTREGKYVGDEYRQWYTLLVSDIPKNITEIRFVISE